ncbi:MAG: hypothetical protein JWP22_2627 [Ramlibacter sp.]|jgi:hypothetical protein|nr:hypothetical protein [Ramlibacter sp.]
MNKHLISLAIALCGIAGSASAADAPITKDAYKAAMDKIEAGAKADKKACGALKANAKDICQAQAKGKEKVAKAELEARYHPGALADQQAKNAKADADYEVAKERCDDAKGQAKDACLERAKHDKEAAIRLAKVEKVDSMRDAAGKAARDGKHARAGNNSKI